MTTVLDDPKLEAFLDGLHERSLSELPAIAGYLRERAQRDGSGLPTAFDRDMHRFFADKMVALEKDKCQLCYLLCRSLGARRVVEAGTSFGVSTLYLAAAVRDNGGGTVIGTEYEPEKIAAARDHFRSAGLEDYIELLQGDLRETLRHVEGPIDFMLADIWEVARPALERIAPKLRRGSVVMTDATTDHRDHYGDYFAFLHDPQHGFRTMTLPFTSGFELSVKL